MARLACLALSALLAAPPLAAGRAEAPTDAVQRIVVAERFKAAAAFIARDHERIVADIVRLTETPAPPFKEAAKGALYLEMLRQHGLAEVGRDAEGSVMGVRPGARGGGIRPLIAIAAHLDTVFPDGTDVTVKRSGTRLAAPGVGDDSRALAVLLGLVRALDHAKIATTADILIVGDVGEEGPGDLRGMKHLFTKGPYAGRITAFVSIDGIDSARITTGAVGSKRWRVTFKGPGGHSYAAFGLVNPMFALGDAVAAFARIAVPETPKTTFNVGVLGGGTSVNSIPVEAWMDVDMRSEAPAALAEVERQFLAIVAAAVERENRARSTKEGRIEAKLDLIGDRPSGRTADDAAIVALARAAVSAHGLEPRLGFSSTDSNIPISLGIPAITIGSGGSGGRQHSIDEWIDVEPTKSVHGIVVALTILLAIAGME
jgi:acetylornithine deacetylase/succinyl-diaminopimelate desuccinylase-like protein